MGNYKPDPQVLSKIDFEAFPTDKDIAFYLDVNNAPAALPHTLKAARQPPNYPFYEYVLAKETLGFEANNAFTLVPKGSQRITRTRAVFVKRPDGRAKVRIAIRGDTIPVDAWWSPAWWSPTSTSLRRSSSPSLSPSSRLSSWSQRTSTWCSTRSTTRLPSLCRTLCIRLSSSSFSSPIHSSCSGPLSPFAGRDWGHPSTKTPK